MQCYRTPTCPIPKCTFSSDKEKWKADMEAHLLAHFYRRVCGCGESFVTNSQIDNHMTRKGKGDPATRRTECFHKFPKKHKVSLRTWGLFKQRTGIPIPDEPPIPKFGWEQREVTAAMPSLAVVIDVNKITTSHKRRRIEERLGPVPAPIPNARPPAPRQASPPPVVKQKPSPPRSKGRRNSSPPRERRRDKENRAPATQTRQEAETGLQRHRREAARIRRREAQEAANTAREQARALVKIEDVVTSSLRIAMDALDEGRAVRRALQESTRTLHRYLADSPSV